MINLQIKILCLIAQLPNYLFSPLKSLIFFIYEDNYHYVARNPNCPLKLLEQLADDKDRGVRSYVARHPNCSLKLLEKLADDEFWFVRSSVAKHPNCPQYLKEYFRAKEFMEYYGFNI